MVMRATDFVTDEQKVELEQAIADAEKNTTGEIVVVIATRSGRYDRAEDLFGVLTACLTVIVGWLIFQNVEYESGEWFSGWIVSLGLLPILALFIGGFALGTAIATVYPALATLFFRDSVITEDVRNKAAQAFYNFRVDRTDNGTGILIYVSLLEHRIWVTGDDAINESIEQEMWDQIRDLVTDGFRKKDAIRGLDAAIRRCGVLLEEHLPLPKRKKKKANELSKELSNELRLID